MRLLNNRIAKLEERIFIPEREPIFIHRTILEPSEHGPVQVEPLYREAKLHDEQLLRSEPSESLEDFQKRILEADTKCSSKHGYSIVDVIGLAGGNLMLRLCCRS